MCGSKTRAEDASPTNEWFRATSHYCEGLTINNTLPNPFVKAAVAVVSKTVTIWTSSTIFSQVRLLGSFLEFFRSVKEWTKEVRDGR